MNIRNKEGYMDTTPYEAIKAIEKKGGLLGISPIAI